MIVDNMPGNWYIVEETYLQDVPVYVLAQEDCDNRTIVVHVEPNNQGYYVQI